MGAAVFQVGPSSVRESVGMVKGVVLEHPLEDEDEGLDDDLVVLMLTCVVILTADDIVV